jgi:replication initiation and membrane attachment protein DnaB
MIYTKEKVGVEISLSECYVPYIGFAPFGFYVSIGCFGDYNEEGKRICTMKRHDLANKLRVSTKTIPLIDEILLAFELIDIKRIPMGKGKHRVVYEILDPMPVEEFKKKEKQLIENLKDALEKEPKIEHLLGWEIKKVMGR